MEENNVDAPTCKPPETPVGSVDSLLRCAQWAGTPLGPRELWPQSLKTVFEILVSARQPMFAWWGEDLLQLHNDGCRAILGASYEAALGSSARAYWPARIPALEAALERVFGGEALTIPDVRLSMERNRRNEECCFDLRLTPIWDDQGRVGGALCVCDERPAQLGETRQLALAVGHVGVWDWDLRSGASVWSDEHFRALGLDPGACEPGYEAWASRIFCEDRVASEEGLRSAAADRRDYEHEYRVAWPDGALHWLYTRARFFHDAAAEPLRMIALTTDVTERKQAEERIASLNRDLKRRVTEFETLLEVAPVGIALANDPECRDITVNPAAAEMLGIPTVINASKSGPQGAELPFRVLREGREVSPEDLPMQQSATKGTVLRDLEYEVVQADGKVVNLIEYSAPLFEDGKVRGCLGVFVDITGRKAAERERMLLLERAQTARRTAELLNQAGLALASELDWEKLAQKITDIATQLTRAAYGAFFYDTIDAAGRTETLYTLSGTTRGAFEGFAIPRDTPLFHSTYAGQGIIRCGDVLADERYGKAPPHYGLPDGHLPVRSYLAAPVTLRSGETLGGLFFGHPEAGVFTEDDEALVAGLAAQAAVALDNARLFARVERGRQELRRVNDELRRANQDLEQFAYSASHDLQEPLRHISIYSELLRRKCEGRFDNEADELMKSVMDGARRMEMLVRDLLAYTQAVNVTGAMSEPVDAERVFQLALSNLREAIRENAAEVTHDPLPPVWAHEVHLVQLFQNLVGNAIKYRRDAEPPRVHARAERAGAEWIFSVRDNGIGIERQYRERIFGLFKRLHGGRKYAGTGIGLAICQKIVESYGGRIWVESEIGAGSTFFFTLPCPGERE
ncbi:MAG: PAS domain-containing protein [Bryobacteraceae bacterium]|nr:PAS domain-containing protein [Bryobacteraceae bacterium]